MIESAFLEEIAESPEDDGLRLIYADWLEENGQARRAAFVRDQIELERMDVGDARYPALLARVRRSGVFTEPGSVPWVDHVPKAKVMFRRGLIAGVELPVGNFRKQRADDWRRVPVESLRLERSWPYPEKISRLCRRPELARLRTLHLAVYWRTEELRPLLTECERLAGVRDLRVEHYQEVGMSLGSLGPALALPSLRSLRLMQHQTSSAWRPIVAGCRTPLERLHLSYESDGGDLMPRWDWIAKTPHWPNLRYLGLHHRPTNGFSMASYNDGEGLQPAFPRAERMEDLAVFPSEFRTLSAVPDWGRLRSLRVVAGDPCTPLDTPQLRQLHRLQLPEWSRMSPALGGEMPNLRHLGVTAMPYDGWPELLGKGFAANLHRLDLGDVRRHDPAAVPAVVSMLAGSSLPELRCLSLGGVKHPLALAPLLDSRAMPNLCTLLLPALDRPVTAAALRLARAKGMPHLSLVKACPIYKRQWWILGEGRAKCVRKDVLPLTSDWWLDEDDVIC